MPRISIDDETYVILNKTKDTLEERGRSSASYSDAIRELSDTIRDLDGQYVIEDWDFSTDTPCEKCGGEPTDTWQMAKVNNKWVCLDCLSKIVSGI